MSQSFYLGTKVVKGRIPEQSPGPKYKKLRNKATNLIRRDTVNANGKRIEEATDENEIWRIVNDITKPKSSESTYITENRIRHAKGTVHIHLSVIYRDRVRLIPFKLK